ncbi:MAG: substrate-binding domain-containing protein [Caldilineaceae bacterium]|nr:substrate-binding domain-containing protein [Caldilineaceae bacterium]MBP8107438.1 substrate-binding domain-containing protein [Caldilineaceae bacterium]MBP8122413.1 substrate-binding domain-containing protein [Caldilineaceae bacterium]MBP9074498.1 substrate-binding domain-containing protein [Caldilineaceae bacterium]
MSNSKNSRKRSKKGASKPNIRLILGIVAVSFVIVSALCVSAVTGINRWLNSQDASTQATVANPLADLPPWSATQADLTVAVSPSMAQTLQPLADAFNNQNQRTPDGETMQVALLTVNPDKMVDQAIGQPPFQAVNPDSSLWLNQMDQRWADLQAGSDTGGSMAIGVRRVSDPVRYATSPIVIAAWESVAQELGWPDQPVGWQQIQAKATADANFKWNHPSTNNAAGMLATLAEFYAGAGLTRGLTAEAATNQATLDYVKSVEATIQFYGEGEEVIVQRLAAEGRNFLDAFVAQERSVIDWNRQHPNDRLVAIYPAEGTLWTDHPLALLEIGADESRPVTDNQRRTFQAFTQFLLGGDVQASLLANGFRPADLSLQLDQGSSPFASPGTPPAVQWREPQTTLQIPSPEVVDVVQNVWSYTKRPTNVYLVVDTSGSMEGEKLTRTQMALLAFVEQIQGSRDKVGIIEFGSGVKNFEPLREVDDVGRQRMSALIESMQADGYTALIDATYAGVEDLHLLAEDGAINALVVMTDGNENDSRYNLNDLQALVDQPNRVPVVVFTIAFGTDVDDALLQEMARLGSGQFRRADETDIEELYRIISTYF